MYITAQSFDQAAIDGEDGQLDVVPHGTVFKMEPGSQQFEMVDGTEWDTATGQTFWCPAFGADAGVSPFRETQDNALEFNGRRVPVAGAFNLDVSAASAHAVVAVLSSAGMSPSVPFLVTGHGTGQHYHQLFSEITGQALDDPVRVGVGGEIVDSCWTLDATHVIYWQSGNGRRFDVLCAVEVPEDIPELEEPR